MISKLKKPLFTAFFFLIPLIASGQLESLYPWQEDYPDAWKWSQYIKMVPNKMGPYALPVPMVNDGSMPEKAEIETGYTYYKYTKGYAPTHSNNTRFFIPIAKNRIGLEVTLMPYESFKYSEDVAYDFHSYGTSGSGGGDVIFNTYIHLLKETSKRPDITLRTNLRTASGSNVDYARHIDGPGYSFDASLGKNIYEANNQTIRIYAMGGFFSWQHMEPNTMQNDAYVYGAGIAYKYNLWKVKGDFGGYSGYLDEGDRPMVLRIEATAPLYKRFALRLQYERGLRDFPYIGYHLRLLYSFSTGWE